MAGLWTNLQALRQMEVLVLHVHVSRQPAATVLALHKLHIFGLQSLLFTLGVSILTLQAFAFITDGVHATPQHATNIVAP